MLHLRTIYSVKVFSPFDIYYLGLRDNGTHDNQENRRSIGLLQLIKVGFLI